MSPAELEQLIRDRLQARDKTIAGHLFRSDTYAAATDRFVAEVLAAAAATHEPAAGRRSSSRGQHGRLLPPGPMEAGLAAPPSPGGAASPARGRR